MLSGFELYPRWVPLGNYRLRKNLFHRLTWELIQVLSRGFLVSTMLTNPKQNKVSIIQAMSELSQSPAQHGRNIVGSFILHSFSHPVGWKWLGVVE